MLIIIIIIWLHEVIVQQPFNPSHQDFFLIVFSFLPFCKAIQSSSFELFFSSAIVNN